LGLLVSGTYSIPVLSQNASAGKSVVNGSYSIWFFLAVLLLILFESAGGSTSAGTGPGVLYGIAHVDLADGGLWVDADRGVHGDALFAISIRGV